jgi:flagellin-like protein
MIKMLKNDRAVSPVIGVMLMLVVTVILAGAVSSFSGGLAGDAGNPSQAVIKADYSQSQGMTITHMGGDVINTLETKIVVSPTKDFGNFEHLNWEVNASVVMVSKDGSDRPWFNPASSMSSSLARTFQPGEVAYVEVANIDEVQPDTYGTGDATSSSHGFNHENALGQRFVLTLVDDGGNTIAKTYVAVQP